MCTVKATSSAIEYKLQTHDSFAVTAMDPLSALRDFAIRGELDKIVRVNDEFRFGSDYTFPCSIETTYRSKQGIPSVTLPDRKLLLDYPTGKVATSDSIEFLVPQNPNEYRSDDVIGVRPSSNKVIEPGPFDDGAGEYKEPEVVNYMALIRASERPLKDREGLLVASTRRDDERQRLESQQRKDGLVAKSRLMGAEERGLGGYGDELSYDAASKPKMHLKGSKIGDGVPLILVPSAFQTLITIYNVKEFLEDGVYIPTDVKVKQMKGAKPDCVTVQKKFSRDRDRVVTAYEVRDKPSALKSEDWDRVVAVFVLGKEWQFKDWPFKDHVEIFNKILGFFMRFEDNSVESCKIVKQWNVKIISISKNKRHQDRAAALDVWDRLEAFVQSRSRS